MAEQNKQIVQDPEYQGMINAYKGIKTEKHPEELQGMIDTYKGVKTDKLPEELQTIVDAVHGKPPKEKLPEELQATVDAYKKMTAGKKRDLHG